MISDTSAHRHAWDQIPWIVNGSLPEQERVVIEAHLQECADCRAEFEFQGRLASSMERVGSEEVDSQKSWLQLRARIESVDESELAARGASEVGARVLAGGRRIFSGEWVPWLVAAMVVQAIGLGALGTVIWSKPAETVAPGRAVYRTLSAQETPSGDATIRVVFSPDMTIARMQELLAAAGLQVQSGPSSAGVWSLEPVRDSNRSATAVALRELRGNSDVRFAEVIGGTP